jgi:urease accessory protein
LSLFLSADPEPAVVSVRREHGRLRTRLRTGLLRPQQLHGPDDRCRIGLLATNALLLGGDVVELDVEVGAGVTLELSDIAGTVAYAGRGLAASWRVRVQVAEGGRLRWAGAPFVVADGAEVTRSLVLELAEGAQALVRETVVLGRAGQVGGALRNRTDVRRAGRPVLAEDSRLDPAGHRRLPGMLGGLRVVDSLLALGVTPTPASGPGLATFRLAEPACFLLRYLGHDPARSPLHQLWSALRLPPG